MNSINIAKIIKGLKTDKFFLNCEIPLEYSCGYPMFQKNGNNLCLQIPLLHYKVTGVVDKTLVYPIRYIVTLSLPDGKFVGFEDLKYHKRFGKVDFAKPIGYFRHDAVKNLNKLEYKHKRAELYDYYDKILNAFAASQEPSQKDIDAFKELLGVMLEPSLKPIYRVVAADFYNKYL